MWEARSGWRTFDAWIGGRGSRKFGSRWVFSLLFLFTLRLRTCPDGCANDRPGKGTHAEVKTAMERVRRVAEVYERMAWSVSAIQSWRSCIGKHALIGLVGLASDTNRY